MNRHSSLPLSSPSEIRRVVDWSILTRRSVRAFSDQAVSREDIESILDTARFSASGMNIQPWRVHVVTADAKLNLSAAIAKIDQFPVIAVGADIRDRRGGARDVLEVVVEHEITDGDRAGARY